MVLDIYMPDVDGEAVLEALGDGPDVVVLSAFEYVRRPEIEARYGEKVCAFLARPVLPRVL